MERELATFRSLASETPQPKLEVSRVVLSCWRLLVPVHAFVPPVEALERELATGRSLAAAKAQGPSAEVRTCFRQHWLSACLLNRCTAWTGRDNLEALHFPDCCCFCCLWAGSRHAQCRVQGPLLAAAGVQPGLRTQRHPAALPAGPLQNGGRPQASHADRFPR